MTPQYPDPLILEGMKLEVTIPMKQSSLRVIQEDIRRLMDQHGPALFDGTHKDAEKELQRL